MSITFITGVLGSGMSYHNLIKAHHISKISVTPNSHNSKKALNKKYFTQSLKSMFSSM